MLRVLALLGLGLWALLMTVVLAGVSRIEFFSGLLSSAGLIGLGVIFILMVAGISVMAATSLLCQAVWPGQIGRNRDKLLRWPTRCALAGFLVLIVQVWLVTVAPTAVHPGLFGIYLVVDGLACAQGFPAVVGLCGERIAGVTGPRATAVGTALFAFGGTLPVVGWCLAAGCVLQALGTGFVPGERA